MQRVCEYIVKVKNMPFVCFQMKYGMTSSQQGRLLPNSYEEGQNGTSLTNSLPYTFNKKPTQCVNKVTRWLITHELLHKRVCATLPCKTFS